MLPERENNPEPTILEKLQSESHGRDLIEYAVHKLGVGDPDVKVFLRQYADSKNPTGDPQLQPTVNGQIATGLFKATQERSHSVFNGWFDTWHTVKQEISATTPTVIKQPPQREG